MNPSPATSSKWLVCPRPNPQAGRRVIFFPYAGGGPAAFAKWCSALPNDLEGWTVHYPGRGSRIAESAITTMTNMVDELVHAIQPLLDKPFGLFGHSMGGLIAFELARTLRRKNLPPPVLLFVSACRAPQSTDSAPSLRGLPDLEFMNALKNFNGIPPEILQNTEAMELLLPALRADFELIETYQNQDDSSLDIPILAFGGVDDSRVSREQLEGWGKQTRVRFEARTFPGGHFFIHAERDAMLEIMAKGMRSGL